MWNQRMSNISVSSLLFLYVGCNQAPTDSLSDLKDEAREVLNDAKEKAKEWKELSEDEIKKIWAVEYKTIKITDADADAVEDILNELGQERWDCYHVSEDFQGRTFYFKRPKSSALRHVPLKDLLRIVPFISGGSE